MPFTLLSLPPEIRLRIYEYMLNPTYADATSPTLTRLTWTGYAEDCPQFAGSKAHEIKSAPCSCKPSGSICSTGSSYVLHTRLNLSPAILATCSRVYMEALPHLYEDRVFEAINFRTFGTQHEALLERWWMLDCFLASLSARTRKYVRIVRVPMLMGMFEIYGCAEAFGSINSRLHELKLVEVIPVYSPHRRFDAWYEKETRVVWPLMEFTGAAIRFVDWREPPTTRDYVVRADAVWAAEQREVDKMMAKRQSRQCSRSQEEYSNSEDDHLDCPQMWEA